jgi:hypothetical protein
MMKNKEKIVYISLITFFMFVQLACWTLEITGNIEWSLKNIAIWIFVSISFAILIVCVIRMIETLKLKYTYKKDTVPRISQGKKIYLLSWMIILLSWIPVFLAYYPGILANDSYIQIGQIVNGEYNNHHPLIHTFLIEFFLKVGEFLGDLNLGIGFYTLFQMLCLSATMAMGIALLEKKGIKRIWLWILVIYCALCPINSYLAISMTKDVFFTVFFLLFIFILLELLQEIEYHFIYHIVLILSAIFMILFRNNGKYALLMGLFFSIFLFFGKMVIGQKKQFMILLGEVTISVVLSSLLLGCLDRSVSAQPGDKRELLSLPIQQISRCMVYHGGVGLVEDDDNSINESDKTIINEFLLNNSYVYYDPLISDPVKRNTNTWVVVNKSREFVDMYVGLAFSYPAEYINAFLAVNGGYLAVLDESHSEVNLHEGLGGLGYLQTRWEEATLNSVGIYKDSKLPLIHSLLEKFAAENGYLNIPILKNLIAPGAYIWCYLFLGIWVCFRSEKKYLFPFFFVSGYYITLLLGPTVQLRYIYPVMILFPYIFIHILNRKK